MAFSGTCKLIATELHKGFGPLWHPTSAGGREIAIENLSKRFDSLDRQLGDQSYLRGETFTIADAYASAVLNWTQDRHAPVAKAHGLPGQGCCPASRAASAVEEGLTQAQPAQSD
jgi:glutathione S-transferase